MHEPEPTDAPPPVAELSYAGELQRKALHLIALVVPLGMALLGRSWSLLLLIPAATLAVSADVLRVRSAPFARFIDLVFGTMMRREERPPVGGAVVINGATWVLVAAALLALLFPLEVAVPAFVMFMIADAAAAIVGRRFGRTTWGAGPRTVEGSAGFLVVGLLVMLLFPQFPLWVSAIAVVVACGMEATPVPLNDNVRVPVVTALVLFLLARYALGHDLTLLF